MDWFNKTTDHLWKSHRYYNTLKWLPVIYLVVILGYCVYKRTFNQYDIPEFDLIVDNIQTYITMLKRKVKAREHEKVEKYKVFEYDKKCRKCCKPLEKEHSGHYLRDGQKCGIQGCKTLVLSQNQKSKILELEEDICKWKIEHVYHFANHIKLSQKSIKILKLNEVNGNVLKYLDKKDLDELDVSDVDSTNLIAEVEKWNKGPLSTHITV